MHFAVDTAGPTADERDGHQGPSPVHRGPLDYRRRLRRFGPLVALAVPGACGLAGWALVHASTSSGRGLAGFVLAVMGAPVLLVAGVPMSGSVSTYLLCAALSAAGWMAGGVLAARRAARRPVASWRDFWAEYAWVLGGVWAGVALGLLAVVGVLGTGML